MSAPGLLLLGVTFLGVSFLAAPTSALAQTDQVGQWGPVLNWGRQAKHAVVLPTGNALIWSTGDNAFVWNTATTGSFTPVPFVNADLHCAGQATLADGKVIVMGGVNVTPHIGTPINALFDPFTNTWTNGPPMNYARWYGTATTLADGRLLAANGDDENQERVLLPEVYDPVANTWTVLTGASRSQSLYSFMYQMPDGRVYEAAPKSSTAYLNLSGSGSWSSGPTNSFSSSGYAESGAMYGTGKILRAGGGDPAFANASVINTMVTPVAWRDVEAMAFPRRRHNLVILLDGQVMAVGGTRAGDDESKAILAGEIWNPVTEEWTTVASMQEARMYHSSAFLLPDGRVCAGGGEAAGRLHAEIYSPPYLFKGTRPTISSAPAVVSYGTTFTVSTSQAASITSVAMLRPCGVTHAIDMNQRYIPLTFTTSGSNLSVTAPASGSFAPPGYHMLVIKNSTGVPSVAHWVRLGSSGSLTPGTITGTVTNASNGAAISAATVSYSGGSTSTNSSGNYTLSNVPPGDHLVTASKTGFASQSQTKTVPPGTTVTLNFALVAPGTVSGRVTDAGDGTAIAGATITYSGGSTTTNSSGDYSVSLASGSQTLTASAAGYETMSKTVTVPAGGTVTNNYALQPRETLLQGEVRDALTEAGIDGATVTYSGGSTTTDAFGFYIFNDVTPGTYTVTASAPNYASASSEAQVVEGFPTTADFYLNPSNSQFVTFPPAADARIKFSNATKNYGTDPLLRVQAGEHISYLKFNVANLSGAVQAATLSLFCSDGSNNGGDLYVVSNTWGETTITWNNAPAITGSPIESAGAVVAGNWVDLDVSSVVTGNGTYSFALRSTGTNVANYSAREGTDSPVLTVALGGTPPPPPPSADFSGTPRTGELPLSVDFTDLSTGNPTSWSWLFGDGGSSTEQNPTHVYRGAGGFTVSLTVTNAGGSDVETKTSYITVNDPEGGGPVEHHASIMGGSVALTTVQTETQVAAMLMMTYVAAVSTKPYVDVTGVSGLGLNWTKVRSQCGARSQTGVAVFVAEGEPTISQIVTATFASAPSAANIVVSIYQGANPVDPVGNVISSNTIGLNGACSGGTDNTSYSFNIPVTAPGAAVYAAISCRQRLHTPGAGYTERFEIRSGLLGNTSGLAVMDKVFAEPTTAAVNGTFNGLLDWSIIAIELRP